jgi:hypothetical protein
MGSLVNNSCPWLVSIQRFSARWIAAIICCLFCCLMPQVACAAAPQRAVSYEQQTYPSYNLVAEYAPADKRWVEDVVARVDQARRELNRIMPDALMVQLRVVIAPSHEEFLRQAGGWAEHAVAVAVRTRPVPTVIVNAEKLRVAAPVEVSRTLLHELVHCYLGLRCKAPLPRWLEEGIATTAANEWSLEDAAAVTFAALLNRLIPLRELERHFPSSAEKQRLAYQQSSSVVRFLMAERHATLGQFVALLVGEQGEKFVAELWNPLYVEPLELRWKASLRSWRAWLVAASNSGLFWGAVAVLTLLAWYLKKRRNEERRREWEEEEKIYAVLDEEEERSGSADEEDEEENQPRPPWYE